MGPGWGRGGRPASDDWLPRPRDTHAAPAGAQGGGDAVLQGCPPRAEAGPTQPARGRRASHRAPVRQEDVAGAQGDAGAPAGKRSCLGEDGLVSGRAAVRPVWVGGHWAPLGLTGSQDSGPSRDTAPGLGAAGQPARTRGHQAGGALGGRAGHPPRWSVEEAGTQSGRMWPRPGWCGFGPGRPALT